MFRCIFWLVLVKGNAIKNPIVTIIIRIYPLSCYGFSAVNVYPLQNDPPLAHWGSSVVCPAALGYDGHHTWHIWEPTIDYVEPPPPICPSLRFSFRQRKYFWVIVLVSDHHADNFFYGANRKHFCREM